MRRKFMPDGSNAIARFQVFEKKGKEYDYHLAFDTKKQASKYVKEKQKQFKIVKKYI